MATEWSDLSRNARALGGTRGPNCSVGTFLDSLTTDEAHSVNKALADQSLTNPGLYRAIVAKVGEERAPAQFAIGNHRRLGCRCGKGKK